MFSARASWDLTPSPLAERVVKARASGAALFDLTNANPASLAAPGAALAEALAEVARSPAARSYQSDPLGDRSAREAIAAYHRAGGAEIAAEQIVLTAGTSEGYAHLFRVLADPGDLVHLPTPGYPLFEHLAELESLHCARYRLREPRTGEPRWPLDLDGLASSLAPNSRAVLAIHPHNPTGSFVAAGDLASLRAVCAERELALLSDEVFADSAPEGAGAASFLVDAADGPLTCVLSGASKVLGVPQLKVAWIALSGPPALRDEALARLEFAADAYLSVSPLVARALPALFARRGEIRAALNGRVAANRAVLSRALQSITGVRVLPAEAGWASIVRVENEGARAGWGNDEELALALLEQARVLIHPGALFELDAGPTAAQLVANLLAPLDEFAEGARSLAQFLAPRPAA